MHHTKQEILLAPYQIGKKKQPNHSILTKYRPKHLHFDSDNKINNAQLPTDTLNTQFMNECKCWEIKNEIESN